MGLLPEIFFCNARTDWFCAVSMRVVSVVDFKARKKKPRRHPQTVRATIYRVLLTCIVVFSTYCSKIRACSRIETSSSLWTPGNCAYSYRLRKLPGLDWIVALGAQVLSGAFHFGRLDSRYHAE